MHRKPTAASKRLGREQSCDRKATAGSKRAWKGLHDHFPANEWARKTRYGYP